ncbi:MAG: exo-alpha-sialidase [Phycisphaeraceae bacterium]|nr:exo-alpha-sialidase [Phycisphaeraceae bacterium]
MLATTLSARGQSDGIRRIDLFEVGQNGYQSVRIPAIAAIDDKTLLVAAVGRRTVSDWADMDMLLRRSTDGGMTWAEPRVLLSGEGKPVDNPNLIVDHNNGRVHLVFQRDYTQLFHMTSDDAGETFTQPSDITAALDSIRNSGYAWTVVAPGPSSGIRMTTGRLVVPIWLSDSPERQHRPSAIATIFSDDDGQTWGASSLILRNSPQFPNPSESDVIQLPDGRLMLNTRSESDQYRRLVMFSGDGVHEWSAPQFCPELYDPICHASLALMSTPDRPGEAVLVFVNPDSRTQLHTVRAAGLRPRENLTIKASLDGGLTWPVSQVLDPERSGYSDTVVTPDSRIHVVYERGYIAGNNLNTRYLSLITLEPNWLLSQASARRVAD